MKASITNNGSYIEIEYNELTEINTVIWSKQIIMKPAIVGFALEKNNLYVEISLHNNQLIQTSFERVSIPSCEDNVQLYNALKQMI